MARERASTVVKHGGKPVPGERLRLAETILADFNEQAGTSYGAFKASGQPSDSLSRVLTALGDYPDITAPLGAAMVRVQLAAPYWSGHASPGNVFGPRVVEGNLERARNPSPAVGGIDGHRRAPAADRVAGMRAQAAALRAEVALEEAAVRADVIAGSAQEVA
jgi:hypothetical protein